MSKKRNLIFLSLLVLGYLFLASCFLNPPSTEGILKGQVRVPDGTIQTKDLTGQALPDATVNIIDLITDEVIATTTTDSEGYYQVFVSPGGPYLLEAIKNAVKIEQITCSVEAGMEYDLGIANCVTTAAALIAQAMMDAGVNLVDINCADIVEDSNFNDVRSIVCSKISAGGDPTVSVLVQQAIEEFLNPPELAPSPTPPSLSDTKTITAFDFKALDPDVIGVIDEGAKTITLTVPFGTDVTALVPTILYTGISVSPASDTAQDFTSAVIYTVIAEDTSTQDYLVTVTIAAPVITTTSTIANGTTAPTVTVTGINFKDNITETDLTVGVGTTTLTLDTVSFVSASEITVVFTGTSVAGEVTIQAKPSAFDLASLLPSNTLTVTVPEAVINIAIIPGVTVPIAGAIPVTEIIETIQYTGTVAWNPEDDPFLGSIAYTAMITLTPKAGFTLTGVAEDFFKVAGAVTTNPIDSGVVTARFLVVGASYGGGKVAYIFQSGDPGYVTGEQHGLIAAENDQSAGMQWDDGSPVTTGAIGKAIGFGQVNTAIIVAKQGVGSYAAQLCNNLIVDGYDDWFLPSIDELNKLYINKDLICGFANGWYWSSSEDSVNANNAWLHVFITGIPFNLSKDLNSRVRAIRAF